MVGVRPYSMALRAKRDARQIRSLHARSPITSGVRRFAPAFDPASRAGQSAYPCLVRLAAHGATARFGSLGPYTGLVLRPRSAVEDRVGKIRA
jgi:hypothetical protein